ncbi:MAG: hypothetical protein KGJ23_07120 [Euryarchaeota archaeon]|nr:hypothetical protein [Euryarchaeota archaeon]MDE1881467.1 hypothetical protein [Euryarchaeota archaeon]MDE2044234.1 hypothetical protein [Thermoplasmata archaeon]
MSSRVLASAPSPEINVIANDEAVRRALLGIVRSTKFRARIAEPRPIGGDVPEDHRPSVFLGYARDVQEARLFFTQLTRDDQGQKPWVLLLAPSAPPAAMQEARRMGGPVHRLPLPPLLLREALEEAVRDCPEAATTARAEPGREGAGGPPEETFLPRAPVGGSLTAPSDPKSTFRLSGRAGHSRGRELSVLLLCSQDPAAAGVRRTFMAYAKARSAPVDGSRATAPPAQELTMVPSQVSLDAPSRVALPGSGRLREMVRSGVRELVSGRDRVLPASALSRSRIIGTHKFKNHT